MDPLTSLDSIAELIRRRSLEMSSGKLDKRFSEKLSQTKVKHNVAKLQTADDVKLKIVIAINAIDGSDSKKSQKIVGIFVENVLLWKFGEELINDPNFINLVDDVGSLLLKEPLIYEQLNSLAVSR
jgi:hypothetical protein